MICPGLTNLMELCRSTYKIFVNMCAAVSIVSGQLDTFSESFLDTLSNSTQIFNSGFTLEALHKLFFFACEDNLHNTWHSVYFEIEGYSITCLDLYSIFSKEALFPDPLKLHVQELYYPALPLDTKAYMLFYRI